MSDFISAIKRFIEDWVESKPRLVHYETVQPAENDKALIEQRHIVIRRIKRTKSGEQISIESTINILIGPGCDLSGQDLGGAQLEGFDLRGANFRGAWLNGANLRGANLSGADFTDAQLVFAQLRDAIVNGTNFTNANLTGANIVGADISQANMWIAKMLNTTTTGDVDFYTYLKGFNPDLDLGPAKS
ncbi:MAG: pentapeptide repeat-containing protein [Actinomycetota bacterium]|nr:pentapeptide repeat-containing protein [Actinomycetota bacterium]MDA3019029.1 pentapeptide repeat-containing protein [Actinomycetota bacterium]